MEDNLKSYIENEVGFMSDKTYYEAVKALLEDLLTKERAEEIAMYAETHRSDLISENTRNYIKKRKKIFSFYREINGE